MSKVVRDDAEEPFYFRPPEIGDGPFTSVQDAFHSSEPRTFSAWARYNSISDSKMPKYLPSAVLNLVHMTQLGSIHVKRNCQNKQDIEDLEKKDKVKIAESEHRYQPDLHPILLEIIAAQDAQRFRDMYAAPVNELPQIHHTPLRSDLHEMGSFEVDDPLLSCYGYIQPEAGYEGMECRVDDSTWISTTPFALQHAASMSNCALSQNSILHYCCDAVMAQFNMHEGSMTHTIDPLHVYFSQITRLMQQILTQQSAQLTAACQHNKYMLRDALTRCCDHKVRRGILCQPLLQNDRLWEPIERNSLPKSFADWMEKEDLRPAPPIIVREIEREHRKSFGLASTDETWMDSEVVKEAHERVLHRQRQLYALRKEKGTLDEEYDVDPDDRSMSRLPSDLRTERISYITAERAT